MYRVHTYSVGVTAYKNQSSWLSYNNCFGVEALSSHRKRNNNIPLTGAISMNTEHTLTCTQRDDGK